jgi:hypothetical protein
MAVAFSLFVLAGVQGQLKAEGVDLDFREVAARTANLFFVFHPDEDRAKSAMEGIKMFQAVAQTHAENVKEWQDSLMRLIPMYILQWTTENAEMRKLDFIPLFGTMLSSLLKAIE